MATRLDANAERLVDTDHFPSQQLLAHNPVAASTGKAQGMVILQSSRRESEPTYSCARRGRHAATVDPARSIVRDDREALPAAPSGQPRNSFSNGSDGWRYCCARFR